jgi:Tfp pilus assembly protein PilX
MYRKNEKGFLSILAIIIVVVVSFICMAATYQFINDSRQATNSLNSSQAFYIAQSGIEYAKHLIRKGTNTCGASFNNISFANGTFTTLSSLNSVSHQCTLTSTGNSPSGQRIVRAVLGSSGIASSPLMSSGNIALNGNATVVNNYSNSTVDSGGTVTLQGSVTTTTNTGGSSTGNINTDIIQNDPSLTQASLFNQFFTAPQTITQVGATATQVDNHSNLPTATATGGIYYTTDSLKINGNATIGSPTKPVILLVNNTIDLSGTVIFYGLIYAVGAMNITGTLNVYGSIVSEAGINKGGGTATITFDPSVLNLLSTTIPNTVLHYYDSPTSLKEMIP